MQFTVIFLEATSLASDLVKPSIAALEALKSNPNPNPKLGAALFDKNINLNKESYIPKNENYDLQTDFIIEKEISEQNHTLKNLINKRMSDKSQDTFPEINRHRLLSSKKIIFTGMGSSYNAAQYGSLSLIHI